MPTVVPGPKKSPRAPAGPQLLAAGKPATEHLGVGHSAVTFARLFDWNGHSPDIADVLLPGCCD